MDRRTTLAALASLGTHALYPRVLDAFAQAAASPAPWRPRALGDAGGAQVAALADAILPDTDTPGARAAGVHVFIDLVVADCLPPADRRAFVDGLAAFDAACRTAHGTGVAQTSPALLTALLSKAETDGSPFVKTLKALTVHGYGVSRIGATQALAYEDSPGRYRGCIDLAPGQRTWAER
jgi:hypothetical protein